MCWISGIYSSDRSKYSVKRNCSNVGTGKESLENGLNSTVIDSDSYSERIPSGNSIRMEIINEIFVILRRLGSSCLSAGSPLVPAHVGVEENEQVDNLAKQTLKNKEINSQIPLNKVEAKTYIKT